MEVLENISISILFTYLQKEVMFLMKKRNSGLL